MAQNTDDGVSERGFSSLSLSLVLAGIATLIAVVFADPAKLIQVFNGLTVAVSFGVCVAYAPTAWDGASTKNPSNADILGLGIFLTWAGGLSLRAVGALSRTFGWHWLTNSEIISIALFLSFSGAVMHLMAPRAIKGRLPALEWARLGIICAIGAAIVVGLLTAAQWSG